MNTFPSFILYLISDILYLKNIFDVVARPTLNSKALN